MIPAFAQTSDLQKLFTDYYEFTLRDNPNEATMAGRSDYNDRWPDPSPEHQARKRAELASFRNHLQQFNLAQLSAQDRLSVRILDWTLNDEIARINALGEYDSVNHFFGGHLNIFSTLSLIHI